MQLLLFQGIVQISYSYHVQMRNVAESFRLPDLPTDELTKQCETLLDGKELALEMQSFPHLPKANMTNLELLTFLQ